MVWYADKVTSGANTGKAMRRYPLGDDGSTGPVITSIDLTSNVLTVTGAGFGTKATAAPKKYSNFQGLTNNALLSSEDADWPGYGANDGGIITDTDVYDGDRSVYNRIGPANPNGGRGEFDTNSFTFTSSFGKPVFISYKHLIKNWSDANDYGVIKHARIGSTPGGGGGGGVYNGAGVVALSNYQFMCTNSSDTAVIYFSGNGYINPDPPAPGYMQNDWITINMLIIPNTPGVANGTMRLETIHPTRGSYVAEKTDLLQLETGSTLYHDSVLLGLMGANPSPTSDYDLYSDNVYVDNSLQRVVITDTEDITQANFYETQVLTSWSGSSVQATFARGRLPVGTNYVHLYDENNQKSNAYQVGIS